MALTDDGDADHEAPLGVGGAASMASGEGEEEVPLDCRPLVQWLRREAVRRTAEAVAGSGRGFAHRLERLLWPYLRQAVRVPRDARNLGEALRRLPHWPPTTVLVAPGTYREHLVLEKPVTILGEGEVVVMPPDAAEAAAAAAIAAVSGNGSAVSSTLAAGPIVRVAFDVGAAPGSNGSDAGAGPSVGTTCSGADVVDAACDADTVGGSSSSTAVPELRQLRLVGDVAGVIVERGAVRLHGCSVSASADFGVVAGDTAQVCMENCDVTGCQRAGLLLKQKASGRVSGCRFFENPGAGVQVQDEASAVISSNQFSANRGAAVLVRSTSSACSVIDNTMESNKGCGILVRGAAQPLVARNTVRRHKMAAVALQQRATGRVCENILEENDGVAILVSGSAAPVIERNELRNNRRAAPVIEFQTDDGVVRARIVGQREDAKNKLTHELDYISGLAGQEWVSLDESRKIVANQGGRTDMPYEIKGAMRAGRLDDGEGGTLSGASATKGVKRSAIAIKDESQAVIRNNRLQNNQGYGILVSNKAKPLLEGNELRDHANIAIVVENEAEPAILKNLLRGNRGVGVEVRNAARPTIEGNDMDCQDVPAIRFGDDAAGTARQNRLHWRDSSSMGSPIVVRGAAKPVLEENEELPLEAALPTAAAAEAKRRRVGV
eukprot:TRINITY_DN1485_c1_g1_i1.p1 TRINITY_DN1485_c1_g1~~TRINITY_DN1485_c1_g1_i1.p1  ORF type:complete len:665 (+),score=153.86 TRINITY_DN1485_c1_g1_i1:55-2049(+)